MSAALQSHRSSTFKYQVLYSYGSGYLSVTGSIELYSRRSSVTDYIEELQSYSSGRLSVAGSIELQSYTSGRLSVTCSIELQSYIHVVQVSQALDSYRI